MKDNNIEMKHLIIKSVVLVVFLIAKEASAQSKISGCVLSESNLPVAFADVVLIAADSTFLNGTITAEDGMFSVESVNNAKYLTISCLGYETKSFDLDAKNAFERIILSLSYAELQEIVISGGLPKTRIKDGAMVTTVQNTALENTTTADKLLAKIPGVRSTQSGIEVFGKGTPEIYINNIKVRDETDLKNLDPKSVKTVEVITNPGVEYGSEVQSVIKIVTGKPVGEGMGFTYLMQYEQNCKADFVNRLSLNYRKKKFDVFCGVLFYDANDRNETNHYNLLKSNALWEQSTYNLNDVSSRSIDVNGGVNYQLNEKNSAGFTYGYVTTLKQKETGYSDFDVFKDGVFYDRLYKDAYGKTDFKGKRTLNAYYNGEIGGFSVDFNADLCTGKSRNFSKYAEASQGYEDRDISASDKIFSNLWAEKLVLSHELWGGNFSIGGEESFTNYKDNYQSYDEKYVPTVESESRQNNAAAFLNYAHKIANNLVLKAGIRYEHVDFKYFDDGVLDDGISRSYNNLYPSANLAFTPGSVQMNLSFVRKTKRPSYFSMRNSYYYINRYEIESGNSTLQPREISDLTYAVSWKDIHFSASYKNVKNMIMNWNVDDDTKPEILISRPINYDKKLSQLSLHLYAAPEFGVYSPSVDLTFEKQNLSVVSRGVKEKLGKPRATAEIDHCLDFDSGWSFELDCYFYGKGHHEEYYYNSDYFTFDFCVNKTLFNDALTIELGVSDITDKDCRDVKYLSTRGWLNVFENTDTRSFYAVILYRFNPAKSKYKGTGAGNDEKQRM